MSKIDMTYYYIFTKLEQNISGKIILNSDVIRMKRHSVSVILFTKTEARAIMTMHAPQIPAQMVANGNTVMINYVIRVPYNDLTIDINVCHWFCLQEDGVI